MKREYYSLGEAAKIAGVSEADLIHFGATGRLDVYALLPGVFAIELYPVNTDERDRKILNGPHLIAKDDLLKYEAGSDPHIECVDEIGFSGWMLDGGNSLSDFRLVILEKDLSRLEIGTRKAMEPSQKKLPTDNKLIQTIAALLAAWPKGKLPSGKDLEQAAQSIDISISDDTIRKAIDAARKIAPKLPPA